MLYLLLINCNYHNYLQQLFYTIFLYHFLLLSLSLSSVILYSLRRSLSLPYILHYVFLHHLCLSSIILYSLPIHHLLFFILYYSIYPNIYSTRSVACFEINDRYTHYYIYNSFKSKRERERENSRRALCLAESQSKFDIPALG